MPKEELIEEVVEEVVPPTEHELYLEALAAEKEDVGIGVPIIVDENDECISYRKHSAAGMTEWTEAKPGSAMEAEQVKAAEITAIRAKCAEGKATLEDLNKLLAG